MKAANARQPAGATLSRTCGAQPRPLVAVWDARALYIGPAFGLAAHRNAVAVLAVGLHDPVQIAVATTAPRPRGRRHRAVLLEPAVLARIRATPSNCAFLYVDPMSDDLRALRARCRRSDARIHFDLEGEDLLLQELLQVERAATAASCERLITALGLPAGERDPRIGSAVRALRAAPGDASRLVDLAAAAGLSPSHFQRLFHASTGVVFRRYRLWARMGQAVTAALRGAALTDAAHDAGFASSAHLSTAFREMFGMAPSQLVGSRPRLLDLRSSAAPARPAQRA